MCENWGSGDVAWTETVRDLHSKQMMRVDRKLVHFQLMLFLTKSDSRWYCVPDVIFGVIREAGCSRACFSMHPAACFFTAVRRPFHLTGGQLLVNRFTCFSFKWRAWFSCPTWMGTQNLAWSQKWCAFPSNYSRSDIHFGAGKQKGTKRRNGRKGFKRTGQKCFMCILHAFLSLPRSREKGPVYFEKF